MMKLRATRKQDALLDGEFRYCGVAAAIVGGAVIGGVASNMASKKAADAQEEASNQANDTSQRQYDQTRADQLRIYDQQRADQADWLAAGKNALARVSTGLAHGGEYVQKFDQNAFNVDPGYQFSLAEGQKGLDRSAAARGMLLSGAQLKAGMRYNQDAASQEYGNAYNRFTSDQSTRFNRDASVAGLGQTATNTVGQAGQNAFGNIAQAGMNNANTIGGNQVGAGNARASGYVGGANALTSALGQGIGYWQNQQMLNSLRQKAYGSPNQYGYDSGGYPVDSGGSLQFDA